MFKSLQKTGSDAAQKTGTHAVVTPQRLPQAQDREDAVLRRPAMRINETDTTFELVADMPGVTAETVEVTLERGVLTLRGTAPTIRPEQSEPLWREFAAGAFERSFELPAGIDPNGITATTRHGQVRLSLAKEKAVQPRRIAVTTA